MNHQRFSRAQLILFVGLCLVGEPKSVSAACAQSVLVVVNSQSPESLAVANHYISLREIPPANVVYLDGVSAKAGDDESISSANYRTGILEPITKLMEERDIRQQINCIAYSAGFPTRVLVEPEMKKYLAFRRVAYDVHLHSPFASLNSATFFQHGLFSDKTTFLDEHSNWYAQESFDDSRPFSSQIGWLRDGTVATGDEGRKYMLSTVLAVVRPKGSTVDQALAQLTRSVAADGKNPHGIFYFADHLDPRSRTRKSQFASVAATLQQMGYKVEVAAGKMPKNKRVLGATLGSSKLDWSKSQSAFAPGAICDNFTSFGGWFRVRQTKLTHYLNHGAAGAVGTVCEPYTIPVKIPTTAVFVHYVRGCTLAESIYQSVLAPFQLLVVGDPLCRPFASLPDFSVEGIKNKSTVREDLEIKLKAKFGQHSIERYCIYLDGVLEKTSQPDEVVKIPIGDLTHGYHELQITAFDNSVAQASRTRTIGFFVLHPDFPQPLLLAIENPNVHLGDKFVVSCDFPQGFNVDLVQNSRVIGKFRKSSQPVEVEASLLGLGKTNIYASTSVDGRPVRGVPASVVVTR